MSANRCLLNHVALLVPSVTRSSQFLEKKGYPPGPPAEWPGEGTLEIYVGAETYRGRILLMEPLREGAYARALKKRGPGLHHIAIDVADLDEFATSLSGSGWLLHPRSVSTLAKSRTLWLARPGVPTLIEVQERSDLPTRSAWPNLVTRLELPAFADSGRLLQALRTSELSPDLGDPVSTGSVTIADQKLNFSEIISGHDR